MWELLTIVVAVVVLVVTRGRRFVGLCRALGDWDMFTAKNRRSGHDEGRTEPGPHD